MVNGLRGGGTRLRQVSVIIEVKQRPDRIIINVGVLEKELLAGRVVVGVEGVRPQANRFRVEKS